MEEKDKALTPETSAPGDGQGQEVPKHPPMFSREKMYKNIPFNVKQMDRIIIGVVAAMALCLIVGLIWK